MENDRETIRMEKLRSVEQWPMYKFQVRVIMKASEVWEIVSGDSKKPEKTNEQKQEDFDELLKAWIKNDNTAQKIIVTSLGHEPLLHILKCETARDMWIKLETVYEQKTKASIHLLQQKFYNFNKCPTDNMAVHISKLVNLVQQLKDMGEIISNSMLITKILMTLPMELNHFLSAWEETSSDEQTLDNLTSRLVNEELRLEEHWKNSKKCGAGGTLVNCLIVMTGDL